ncbi:porin family protein [uncultured Lutibacter sp.]|uniref:porin family protein n=1 Tax=uncultured Lutibacter sp. TaxID=437739 RepID=UPI00261CD47F|nr:porin family protein [uncultured Lutibacter sp.]
MSKYWIIISFLLFFFNLEAQVNKDSIDLRYLEDQIYLSLTYNILTDKPSDVAQNGFSGGVSFGFIKDIPFNENRNFGIGIGLGYAYNAFIQNLKISTENQITLFEAAQDYDTNRFGISALEMPIEIRWRNSTPQKYKFWRVYGGVKLAYVVSAKTIYRDTDENISTKNVSEFNKIQYGLTLSTGFSTWNLYVYYGLNPIFKSVNFNNEKLDLKEFNVGLKFYIM